MQDQNIKIKDLEYNNQPIWFAQNNLKRYKVVSSKGNLASLCLVGFIFVNIAIGVTFIDLSQFGSLQFYLAILQIVFNVIYFIAAMAVMFCLAGLPYQNKP
jgi:hypothetical protein